MNKEEHYSVSCNLNEVRKATLYLYGERRKRPICEVINDLEEWYLQEHQYDDRTSTPDKVYYGCAWDFVVETYPKEHRKHELVNKLQEVKQTLERNYRNSILLIPINEKLNAAIESIENWPNKISGVPREGYNLDD